jgi:hypothetical protein
MRTGIQLLVGAALIGSGILTMAMGGVAVHGGEVAEVYSTLGFDGVNDLGFTSSGTIALVLCGIGAALMVSANAVAYKETGGY